VLRARAATARTSFGKRQIRADGWHIHPMYLCETKKPAEPNGNWDVFKLVSTIAPDDVWRPMDKGGCPFAKG
jgi:branched-chain amino acid transport system substrate-binding protein